MKKIFRKLIMLSLILSPLVQAEVNSNNPNIKISADLVYSHQPFTVEHHSEKGTLFIGKHVEEDQKRVYFLTNQGKSFDHVTDLPFEEIISVFLYKEPSSKNPVIYVLGRNRHDTEMYTGFDYNFTKLHLTFDKDNILRIIYRPDPLLYQHMNCFDGVIFGKKKQCEYTNESLFKAYLDRTLNPEEEQTVIAPSIPPELNSNRRNIRPTPEDLETCHPPLVINYHGKKGTLFIGKKNVDHEKPIYLLTNEGKEFDYIFGLPFDEIVSVFLYKERNPEKMVIYILGRKIVDHENSTGFDYNYTDLPLTFDENNILRITRNLDPLLYVHMNCFNGIRYGEEEKCEYTNEVSLKAYLDKEQ